MSEALPLLDPPAPGLYPGVPADVYHRWLAASHSLLVLMRDRSPAHAWHAMLHPEPPTPAEAFGQALHVAVLQPHEFAVRYVRGPEGDRRTKAVKEAWEQLQAEHPGAIVLPPAEYDQVIAVRDAVLAHPAARKLLQGDAELSAVWQDGGVTCKARFDCVNSPLGVLVDVKTAQDASPAGFSRALWGLGYHIQAAHYMRGAQLLGLAPQWFVFVVAEKEPPYGVAVYHLAEEALQAGSEELQALLVQWAQCERSGQWPSYPAEVQAITLPPYAWRQLDERMARP